MNIVGRLATHLYLYTISSRSLIFQYQILSVFNTEGMTPQKKNKKRKKRKKNPGILFSGQHNWPKQLNHKIGANQSISNYAPYASHGNVREWLRFGWSLVGVNLGLIGKYVYMFDEYKSQTACTVCLQPRTIYLKYRKVQNAQKKPYIQLNVSLNKSQSTTRWQFILTVIWWERKITIRKQ